MFYFQIVSLQLVENDSTSSAHTTRGVIHPQYDKDAPSAESQIIGKSNMIKYGNAEKLRARAEEEAIILNKRWLIQKNCDSISKNGAGVVITV